MKVLGSFFRPPHPHVQIKASWRAGGVRLLQHCVKTGSRFQVLKVLPLVFLKRRRTFPGAVPSERSLPQVLATSLKMYPLRVVVGLLAVVLAANHAALAATLGQEVVATQAGLVKGHTVASPSGKELLEFLGIPFARPPVAELRFANPVPPEPWEGVRETVRYGNSCRQWLDMEFPNEEGSTMWNAKDLLSEDCLYLNVWTPSTLSDTPRAVMVWIYGGGFYGGSSSLWVYDGKELAAHSNVVVVSMNYRTGVFGFLSTGDGRIPGNFGLMDQSLALQWIKDNVANFGGDPNKVTLLGESAGSASVGYQLLSPVSQGLFQRAVLQSASPDSYWSYMSPMQAEERAQKLLTYVGCPNDNTTLECLRQVDSDTLYENEWVVYSPMTFPWVPTVALPFLPAPPKTLLEQGGFPKVDILAGANKDEGTFFILYPLREQFRLDDEVSPQSVEQYLHAMHTMFHDLRVEATGRVSTYYSEGIDPSDGVGLRDAVDDAVGDRSFLCPVVDFADRMAESGHQVYFYHFLHRASNEPWPEWMGTIHAAEIQFEFGMPMNISRGYTDEERVLASRVMTYFSNFAKFGNPNGETPDPTLPNWPAFTSDLRAYLEISTQPETREGGLRRDQCAFWREMNAFRRR